MRNLKLFATGSATANAVLSVQIPSRSVIRAIQAAVYIDSITDNASVKLELSYVSVTEMAVNNTQASILVVSARSNFVTSGLAHFGVNQTYPVRAEFSQGQFIYLHALVVGTITYDAEFILWF